MTTTKTTTTGRSRRRIPAARVAKRRVTPTCHDQLALTSGNATEAGADPRQGPVPVPAQIRGEPDQHSRKTTKRKRSERADAWSHADLDDLAPCVLCGTPAMLRDPYTNQPCHLACAQAQATERGEPW